MTEHVIAHAIERRHSWSQTENGTARGSVCVTRGALTAELLSGAQRALIVKADDVAKQALVCVNELGLRMSPHLLKKAAFGATISKDWDSIQM